MVKGGIDDFSEPLYVAVDNDEIVGYITKGRGVSVHRTDCVNVKDLLNELYKISLEKQNI